MNQTATAKKLALRTSCRTARLECIAPARPEQNGRLERFHRTLKLHVPAKRHLGAQQRAFDCFRAEYNYERPHTALELAAPGDVYRSSRQKYPRPLLDARDVSLHGYHTERLDRRGSFIWKRKRIRIGEAFAYEHINLWPAPESRWEVYFGDIFLGHINDAKRPIEFKPLRRPKKETM
ncbi:MAG: integrase core domain-containing protein, partial [Myxococcota bacterium]